MLTGFTILLSAAVALVASTIIINIRDGASGGGTILESLEIDVPAATLPPFAIIRSGLSLPGSAATAMTIEGSAAIANLRQSISWEGYDAA